MKTQLTPQDRDKVWQAGDLSWLHYAWVGEAGWQCYPIDPRRSPTVMGVQASKQVDGIIHRDRGFVEVP